MCGAVIPENETLCGDKCKGDYEKMVRRQKNVRMLALLPIVVVIIFFVVMFLLGGR
jgi:predicted nucleic acid-binding Zn ribbon protein